MENLVKLEKNKGTLRILAHINEKGNSRISDIIKEIGIPSNTAYAVLGRLVDLKLVSQELTDEFPSKKCYTLTEEGQQIAKQVEAMRDVLSELGKKKEG